MKTLYIDATVRENSRTAVLASHLLERLGGDVTQLRLEETSMPVTDSAYLAKRNQACAARDFSDPMFDLAKAFAAAEQIVIAAPFWDLSFPASLKQFFEHINVIGLTFAYNEAGNPYGLCNAKRLYYVTTAGGQIFSEAYGFGYVHVFDVSTLTARALIRLCPPWESVSFDAEGRAKEDYECVIVGFGSLGQAVLKQLVMNGQFAGAQFHAAIFSTGFSQEAGYLMADAPALLANYDIRSFEEDARGSEFYKYIDQRLSTLKLIAICTGDAGTNREISDNLMLFLKRRGAENICVVRCGDKAARYQERVGSPILSQNIYTRAFLSAEDADRSAILLNAVYDHSERSDWEKWVACDSFSKISSRASADFMPAFLRAAGVTSEELLAGDWQPEEALLRNLGETEHMRWNAFHFAMGYSTMSEEEFEANAKAWARCKAEGKPCSIKIAKNSEKRTHACLIPWEELDELSRRENAITGRNVDYQQTDIDNVLTLPKLLRAGEKKGAVK